MTRLFEHPVAAALALAAHAVDLLVVSARVGSRALDNTHKVRGGFSFDRYYERVQLPIEDDPTACWIHACLHKIEGDVPNSRYWYRRSGHSYEEYADGNVELSVLTSATPEQTRALFMPPGATVRAIGMADINGLAFSPDERKLYVVEWKGTPNRSIWSYDVSADNTVSNKTKLIDAADQGALDGFRVDMDGNLWCGWGSNGALQAEPTDVGGRKVYQLKGKSEDLDGVMVFNPAGKPIEDE